MERRDAPLPTLPYERDRLRAPRSLRIDAGAASDDADVPDGNGGPAPGEALDAEGDRGGAQDDDGLRLSAHAELALDLGRDGGVRVLERAPRGAGRNLSDRLADPRLVENRIAAEPRDVPTRGRCGAVPRSVR